MSQPTKYNTEPDDSQKLWDEIDALATAKASGDITDAQFARLEELLESNAEARRMYVVHVFEATALPALVQGSAGAAVDSLDVSDSSLDLPIIAPPSSPMERELTESTSPQKPTRSPILGLLNTTTDALRLPTFLSVGFTIVATIGLLTAMGKLHWSSDSSDLASNRTTLSGGNGATSSKALQTNSTHQAATLTGAVDCRWADYLDAPDYGEPLFEGRILDLKEGLAQITFDSGAKLLLQGPATFTVNDSMQGQLQFGKLTALVPDRAWGFTVRTPSAEVIDLGTEFGIDVDESGETEVHVIQGEVVTWSLDQYGKTVGKGTHLLKNGSATLDKGQEDPKLSKANHTRFVREITPQLSDSELPPLPVKKRLALWLAADVLTKTDDQNRVIAWQDIVCGDNQTEESAWQHEIANRPTLVKNAIAGKPAVHFDGQSSFMVTTPLATVKDQTVFLLFRRTAEPDKPHEQRVLLSYNGPPVNIAAQKAPFGILQIDDFKAPGRYRAFTYAGFRKRKILQLGFAQAQNSIPLNETVLLTYLYSPSTNQAELFINGESQGKDKVSQGFDFVSRKIIGKHPLQNAFFEGDIAELIIYNGSLKNNAINRVTHYLAKKYKVDLQPCRNSEKSSRSN